MGQERQQAAEDISFWQARLVQGLLLFAGAFVLLPPLWGLIYLNITGEIHNFTTSSTQVMAAVLLPFPKSQATAAIIGVILALRSISWGSVSARFFLVTCTLIALLVEALLWLLSLIWGEALAQHGFGNDYFFFWLAAWIASGVFFYGLLCLAGFHQRYESSARSSLVAAFWCVVVYAIYTPIIGSIVLVGTVYGDDLTFMLAQGTVIGEIDRTGQLMAIILCLALVTWIRRFGHLPPLLLLVLPFLSCFLFYLFYMIAVDNADKINMAWAFFMLAALLALIGTIGVRQLNRRDRLVMRNTLDRQSTSTRSRLLFALTIFTTIFIVGPILWHVTAIFARALVIGLPPWSFFFHNLTPAYLQAGIIFGGFCAGYGYFTQSISYPAFFIAALIASLVRIFWSLDSFGLSFGFFTDHIGWPMLLYFPASLAGFWLLSRLPCCQRL